MTDEDISYRFDRHDKFLSLTLKPQLNDVQWDEIESLGSSALESLDSYQVPYLVVDLSPLTYIGSAMVALIVRIWKRIKSKNGKMAVVCPDENVLEVLALAGLDKVWVMAKTKEEAYKILGVRENVVKPNANSGGYASSDGGGSVSTGSYSDAGSASLSILAIIAIVFALAGIVLQLWVPSVDANLSFGFALGSSVMAILVGLVSVMNDQGHYKKIGLVGLIIGIAILIVALLKKP